VNELIDISNAYVLTSDKISTLELKAVTVLIEEIERRTGIRLKTVHNWPTDGKPIILVGSESTISRFIKPYANFLKRLEKPRNEGYRILVNADKGIIFVVGADQRGVLYGVGKLLRKLYLRNNSIKIDENFWISSTPKYALRGIQLGYRPKTNAYDAWSVEQFDQYIRELAIFGANSIEILPPRTDDEPISPHMKVDPLKMMIKLSEIIDSYGLDVWIWYPNMFSESDYKNEEYMKKELAEREEIFSKLPRIDAVFIPGGDPGNIEADTLFRWAEQVSEVLHKYHPNAKIWLSPQLMRDSDEWYDAFYANIRKEPEWLGGIVFGPWVKTPLPELRKIIPKKYPIRYYPDITHNLLCQYPVQDWDPAFAITLGRECINPRPRAMKYIHNLFSPYTIGSICYSEGINDDVNKFIWLDQDWNPETPVIETLRDYVRLFISCDYVEDISQGLMALEENWKGPLAVNEQVEITLKQWREIESKAPQSVLNNYRFQMGLLRAYYDAYIKRRLIYEMELEKEALEVLELSSSIGTLEALKKAEAILKKAKREPLAQNYKMKCEELAEQLFKNIGAQLSVEKYGAIWWDRGAFIDDIDMPLSNYKYLLRKIEYVREIESEEERIKEIYKITNRNNPGPGGFYVNFGSFGSLSYISNRLEWEKDPGNLFSPFINFVPSLLHPPYELGVTPMVWISCLTTIYDNPIVLSYDYLDPMSEYILKVTYIGLYGGDKVKLIANDKYLVHDFIEIKNKILTLEFSIPREAIMSGKLKLTWTPKGGRRMHIAELWLIRKEVENSD